MRRRRCVLVLTQQVAKSPIVEEEGKYDVTSFIRTTIGEYEEEEEQADSNDDDQCLLLAHKSARSIEFQNSTNCHEKSKQIKKERN